MVSLSEDLRKFLDEQKAESIRWAEETVADEGAVYVDTETTGLDERAEIIDIAIVDNAGRALVDSLVKPRGHIPPETTAVHGLTWRDVSTAPTWPQVYEEVCRVLRAASRIVIYNVEYDVRVLSQTSKAFSLRPAGPPMDRFQCAMMEYSRFMGRWDSERKCFQRMKLRGGDHRAYGDCLATIELVRRMAAAGTTQTTMF